jgi:RNA polymerase sigma-32 factor
MAPRKPPSSSTSEPPSGRAGKKPRKPRAARGTKPASEADTRPDEGTEPSIQSEASSDSLEPEVLEAEVLDAHFADEDTPEESEVEVRAGDDALPARPEPSALAPTDSLSRYLAEIRSYPILTREEEHEIALRYFHDKDPDAAMRLVTANLRLVVVVAREYQRAFHNLLDLIQEGNVGLLEAVKQFDPYRGVRFPSYAVWWIRAYVIRYVMNNFRLVKVGTTQAQRRLFFNLK